MQAQRDQEPNKHKKLRTACDICHQAKMKCSGGSPCNGCRDSGYECSYSVSNRIGRPKGTKNKRTLERMSRNQAENDRECKSRGSAGKDHGLGIQTGSIAFDNDMRIGSNVTDSVPFDSLFNNHGSYSLPTSATFEPFSDNFNSWYDFSDLSGMSTLTHQSSIGSSYDSEPFMHEDMRPFSHDDSAYVSPSSVFNDSGSASSGAEWSGLLGTMSNDAGIRPDVTTSASSSSISSFGTCNCVQNHAELLCRLKDLEQRHTMPRLDVVLSAAQQALVPWKEVIECNVCQHDDNQEVLVLSGMSIRTILRALSPLCVEYYNNFISSGEAIRRQQPPVSTPDDMKSTIGCYRISGEERMAVTDLLISRCLDQVKLTLACFKTRLETMKARKASASASAPARKRTVSDVEALSRGGPGDLDHLLQVWQNLENTVQMLEGVMRKVSYPVSS